MITATDVCPATAYQGLEIETVRTAIDANICSDPCEATYEEDADAASYGRPNESFEGMEFLPTQYLTMDEANRDCIDLRYVGNGDVLIPNQRPEDIGRKTLVLDLDETLVHCGFEPMSNAVCMLPIVVEGVRYFIYVCVRPGAIEFLQKMGQLYEVIVYTASLKAYAHALVHHIDKDNVVRHILCRDACFAPRPKNAGLKPLSSSQRILKDLTALNRPMNSVLLVENTPYAASLQPSNAIIVSSFIDDMKDDELFHLATYLEYLTDVSDLRKYTKSFPTYVKRAKKVESEGQKSGSRLGAVVSGRAVQRALQWWQKGP